MVVTLYKHLKQEAPTFSLLNKKYRPVLEMVNILIGTIPNCGLVLEIWPTGFRTYNLLVPNLLNLPNSLLGNKSVKKLMGLAMFESSMSSGCNYCSAHCCSFAIRRGLKETVITGKPTEKESAVINFSRKMGEIPCKVTVDDYTSLQKYCSSNEIEAISMAIVLMGFLNKFMDAMGVELEQEAINDVSDILKDTEWEIGKHTHSELKAPKKQKIKVDNFLTYLKVFSLAPGAIKLEKQWLKNVPNKDYEIGEFLKKNIGYDFPVLKKIKRNKLKKVLTTVLRDNFSESNTNVGLKNKIITGLIFSSVIENLSLKNDLLSIAENNNICIGYELQKIIAELTNHPNSISALTNLDSDVYNFSKKEQIAIRFTQQISTSPANTNSALTNEVADQLDAEYIIELVTWISILQAFNRLHKLPIPA